MGVDDVDAAVPERQRAAVGDERAARQAVQREVLARQANRGLRQIDADDTGAASREPGEIGADAAPDLEQALAGVAVESDRPRQVGELVEAVVVEIVEELERPDRMLRHLEIVDAGVPVGTHMAAEIRPLRAGNAGRIHRVEEAAAPRSGALT